MRFLSLDFESSVCHSATPAGADHACRAKRRFYDPAAVLTSCRRWPLAVDPRKASLPCRPIIRKLRALWKIDCLICRKLLAGRQNPGETSLPGRGPVRPLHGQVLPVFCPAPGYPHDLAGFRLPALVPAARPGGGRSSRTAAGTCWSTRPASTRATTILWDLRPPAADLPRVHHPQVRVRGRLGLRPLLGDGRAGRGICRGGARAAARPGLSAVRGRNDNAPNPRM